MICFGKAISGPVTNSAVEMFNLHSLIIGFCSTVANTMLWSTVFCLISPLKRQWNNCKELLAAAQTVIFVTLFSRWVTHILGTESTAFQLAAQILNHREHRTLFKNTRQLRWLRLPVTLQEKCLSGVMRLVKLILFVIKLLLERAGPAIRLLIQGYVKMQIHSWLKFFSPYCMGKTGSQFVIKKAIFMCPSFYCVIKISFSSNIMMYWILFLLWDIFFFKIIAIFKYFLFLNIKELWDVFEILRRMNINSQLWEKKKSESWDKKSQLPFIPSMAETKGRIARCRLRIQRKFRIGRFKLRIVRKMSNSEFILQIVQELWVYVSQIRFNSELRGKK